MLTAAQGRAVPSLASGGVSLEPPTALTRSRPGAGRWPGRAGGAWREAAGAPGWPGQWQSEGRRPPPGVYDESILKPRDEDLGDGGPEDDLSDELYDQALATVSEMRQVSISMLQRKMRIGYNRAARMIERMERDGIVGPADGAKPREVFLRPLGEMPGAGAA